MSKATAPIVARIYALVDPRDKQVRYVGMTTQPLRERYGAHLRDCRADTYRSHWINALRALALKPIMVELETVPINDRADAERRWIAFYRGTGVRLVNATDGGEGTLGLKKSLAERLAIGEASRRRFQDPQARVAVSRVHKGKTISEAHRRLVGEAATRRWIEYRAGVGTLSPESRARISAATKGRKHSPPPPEARIKIAEAKRQFWADRKATGEAASIRQRMRDGIARSGKRAVTGLGTVQVDADGTIHGVSGYTYGCRCGICVAAKTAKTQLRLIKEREARAAKRPIPRSCVECQADITHRHLRARYCEECGGEVKVQARVRQRKKLSAPHVTPA